MDNRRRMMMAAPKKELTLVELLESASYFSAYSNGTWNRYKGFKPGNYYYFGRSMPFNDDDSSLYSSYSGFYIAHVSPLQIIKQIKGENTYGTMQYYSSYGVLYFSTSWSNVTTDGYFIGFTSPYSDEEIQSMFSKVTLTSKCASILNASITLNLSNLCPEGQALFIHTTYGTCLLYKKDGAYIKAFNNISSSYFSISGDTATLKTNKAYYSYATISCN